MARLLGYHTGRVVCDPDDKTTLEPDHVYLAPPDYHLLVEDGYFALSTDAPVQYARPSIDVLFESVADAYAERVVGIVLTGANADGADGLARIKACGGVAIVQDPATSERRAMPDAAIAATATDAVLPHRRDPGLPLRTMQMTHEDRRANILLVDDREENLLALDAILEPLGHRLVKVTSGTAALKELLLDDFACILLDVQMPELDGFEVATLIKERKRSQYIPILFVTALSKEDKNVYRGYSAGAVDYIFKPIDPQILRSKVSVFVELWEKSRQIREQAALLHEQALAALERAGEERYRQLADAMPQIVWTADQTGAATYFNRRWFEYTGMSAEEAGPNSWRTVVHPDDLPEAVSRREETLLSGETFEIEYRFKRGDGVYRWHLGRAVPMRRPDGTIAFWIGTATDIHDRKLIEDQRTFIVAASDAFAQSLDYRETLGAGGRARCGCRRGLVCRPHRRG